MSKNVNARDSFQGRWGFILAAVGSAVGMSPMRSRSKSTRLEALPLHLAKVIMFVIQDCKSP